MTGKSIVLLSAGSGVYEVDYRLSQMTKQRILDDGIGCDLVCTQSALSLHSVCTWPARCTPLHSARFNNGVDPTPQLQPQPQDPAPHPKTQPQPHAPRPSPSPNHQPQSHP